MREGDVVEILRLDSGDGVEFEGEHQGHVMAILEEEEVIPFSSTRLDEGRPRPSRFPEIPFHEVRVFRAPGTLDKSDLEPHPPPPLDVMKELPVLFLTWPFTRMPDILMAFSLPPGLDVTRSSGDIPAQ